MCEQKETEARTNADITLNKVGLFCLVLISL